MKASDCIVKFLEAQNITHVFGYQGGMITHLVDSLSKSSKVKYIQCYHEQSAAIAAEGYALESGKIGVAISTSGPGATNMITGIADAYFGSIPVLYITGQVNTYEYKYDKKIRQIGFQETDIVSIAKPITKYAVMVNKPEELEAELKKAISIALSGRKGPVLVDIPMNIQRTDITEFDYSFKVEDNILPLSSAELREAEDLLSKASKPLVLCGNGIFQSKAKTQVQDFLNRINIPYVVSMVGKSSVNEESENFCGVIGSYGNRCANIIFSRADVVLALGSRLDIRQTGNINSEILKKIKFIHVDIDDDELQNSRLQNSLNLHCDLRYFINAIDDKKIKVNKEWTSYCKAIRANYSQDNDIQRFEEIPEPYTAIAKIRECVKEESVFVTDVGQNQIWAAQILKLRPNDEYFTSGGLAPMGFAIPCAVGAAFANPAKKVVCFTGDGGFHFALQSLQLISQYHLNVDVYVLNNASLGLITQFQTLYFKSNMAGTTADGGYLVPDIKSIASAYNLNYFFVNDISQLGDSFGKGFICEIKLPSLTTVVPKLEFNKELDNMIPYLPENEIKNL